MGRILAILALLAGASLVGCDDPTGFNLTPILVGDTVLIAAPTVAGNEDLPQALDITGDGAGGVVGGRFPERSADALQWDFLLRVEEGQLVLVPARVIGVPSRAAMTQPLPGETFEDLREAPGQSTFTSTESIPLVEGQVYAARSRDLFNAFGQECPQFAKIKPLEVDVATGRARFAILTNERCGDPRLAPV